MDKQNLQIPKERLASLCRKHHIRRLSLFGSVLRDDFRPDSDVDVLIEFQPGIPVGFDIFEVERELSELFGGRKVDIVNPKYMNPRLKDYIMANVQVQYAER